MNERTEHITIPMTTINCIRLMLYEAIKDKDKSLLMFGRYLSLNSIMLIDNSWRYFEPAVFRPHPGRTGIFTNQR